MVADLLFQLVNKSLVIMDEMQVGTRYRMLETIRQYSYERLAESEGIHPLRDRHLKYFINVAEMAEPKLYGAEQLAFLNWLEAENENFRAALEWSLKEVNAELGIRLASALWRFWVIRGFWMEGYEQLKRVLSRNSNISAFARATGLGKAGDLALRNGEIVLAHTLLTESLSLFSELGYEEGIAFALYSLARTASYQTDYGRSMFEESLAIYRKLDNKWGIAVVLDRLARPGMQGDSATVRLLREECLALFRGLSDNWELGRALHNSGEMARYEGNYGRAKDLYEEAGMLHRTLIESKWGHGNTHCGLAYCFLREGDYGQAAAHFKKSIALQKEHGKTTVLIALCVAGLGGVAAAWGRLFRAAQLLGAAKSMIIAYEAKGENLRVQDQVEYDRDFAVVRTNLDEATFNVALESVQNMIQEEALDLALKTAEEM